MNLNARNLYLAWLTITLSCTWFPGCSQKEVASGNPTRSSELTNSQSPVDKGLDEERILGEPSAVIRSYFEMLREREGQKAIRLCWDTNHFAARLYEEDWRRLSPEIKSAIAFEFQKYFVGVYSLPAAAEMMSSVVLDSLREEQSGDYRTIVVDLSSRSTGIKRTIRFLLRSRDNEWRVVDMAFGEQDWMSRTVRQFYERESLSPLAFAEEVNAGLPSFSSKLESNSDADSN